MFRWLADRLQQRDIDAFIAQLREMSASRIGAVAALVAHFRNRYLEEMDVDFLAPREAAFGDPALIMKLGTVAKQFRKAGRDGELNYTALMVWVHTLRAILNPNLEDKARLIWSEVARGHANLQAGLQVLESENVETLEIEEAERFPQGFAPGPRR